MFCLESYSMKTISRYYLQPPEEGLVRWLFRQTQQLSSTEALQLVILFTHTRIYALANQRFKGIPFQKKEKTYG